MMQDWWQTTFPQGRQSLTVRDGDGELVAIAYGEIGTGPPVVLLHGIGSWSYSWRYTIPALAPYYRVICVDAKGYGFSEARFVPEQVGHQVAELPQILTALASEPVTVIGESLGALTALAVAQIHPALIEQMVLINAPVFPQQLPSAYMRWLSVLPLEWLQPIDQYGLAQPFAPLIRQIARYIRQEVVVNPNGITDEEIYWLTYPYLSTPGKITQFATDLRQAALEIQALHAGEPGLLQQIQENLGQVTCPVQILWGDRDRWFPVADGEKLHAHLPNSQFQVIPNCGHNISGGNVQAANAAILEFLQSVQVSG
jgi:pimeloyl-ACP methyl ester carboxylesterase